MERDALLLDRHGTTRTHGRRAVGSWSKALRAPGGIVAGLRVRRLRPHDDARSSTGAAAASPGRSRPRACSGAEKFRAHADIGRSVRFGDIVGQQLAGGVEMLAYSEGCASHQAFD